MLRLGDDDMGAPALAERPVLGLHDSHVTLRGLTTLAERELPELRVLSLYMKNLGPHLVDLLAQAPWRAQLVSLNVCGNRLRADGMEALMQRPWPALTTLAAGFDGLGDEGARAVADAALPALTRLNLRDNGIGAAGASALADRYAPQLVDLGLEDNALGPAGIEALARAPFAHLERIDVRDNGAGSARLADASWAAGVRARGGRIEEGASEAPVPPDDEAGPRWRVRLAIVGDHQPPPDERVLVGRRITMGRGANNDLVLKGSNVSRVHGMLVARDDHLYVVDNGSSNGLYCNGGLVGLRGGRRLHRGDELWLGGYRVRLLALDRV